MNTSSKDLLDFLFPWCCVSVTYTGNGTKGTGVYVEVGSAEYSSSKEFTSGMILRSMSIGGWARGCALLVSGGGVVDV